MLGFKLFLFQSLTRKIAKNICDWNTMWKHFIYIDNNDMTTLLFISNNFHNEETWNDKVLRIYTMFVILRWTHEWYHIFAHFKRLFWFQTILLCLKSISMHDLVSITQPHRFTLVSIHEFTNRWLKFWWDFNFQIKRCENNCVFLSKLSVHRLQSTSVQLGSSAVVD